MNVFMRLSFLNLIFVFLLAGSCFADEQKIKIGVSVPLTGPAASYGTDVRNVLEFARDSLGLDRYEFIIEDDRCNATDAVNIAQKFIHIDRVQYVLGLPCSGPLLAVAPLYNKAEIIVVTSLASAAAVSDAGGYIFRTRPSDRGAAQLLAGHIAKSFKRVAMLGEETDFAQGTVDDLQKFLIASSVETVRENFIPDTQDFRATLLRLYRHQPEVLFIMTQAEDSFAVILNQAHELRIELPVFGSMIPGSQTFIDLLGERANGLIFATLPELDSVLTSEGQTLYQNFLKRYGPLNSMHFVFPAAYESFNALHQAISRGGPPRKNLLNGSFQGIVGEYSFDPKGDIIGVEHVLRSITDGRFLALPGGS